MKMNEDQIFGHYNEALESVDPEIFKAINGELSRQSSVIELIASENMTARAVIQAQGSVLTNKYAEGYPGRRYYGGCDYVDVAESLAIERVTKLFNCNFANVQPHSGATANQAVYLALLKPGAKILSMALDQGGHLTHGSPVNISGKWFEIVSYGVGREDGLIDYDQMEALAREHKPDMIVCGASAYSRVIDWARFRKAADETGAYLLADVAHYAGLIAGGALPNPCEHCDIVTATTHKTLRGPRGGLILWNDEQFTKKINSAVFPGLQGGPLMHVIAGKAVAFGLALEDEFKDYAHRVVDNARTLSSSLASKGIDIISGGTDTHVMLLDLRSLKINGLQAQHALERSNLNCNRNMIPYDPEKPLVTSGLRMGSPASTTRGFGQAEFQKVGELIVEVLQGLAENGEDENGDTERSVSEKVQALCARFPVYEQSIA